MTLQRDSSVSVSVDPAKLHLCSDVPRKLNSVMLQQLKSQPSSVQPLMLASDTSSGCFGGNSSLLFLPAPPLLLLLLLVFLLLLLESAAIASDHRTLSLVLHIVRDRFAPAQFTLLRTAPTKRLPLQLAPSKLLPVKSHASKSESKRLQLLKFMPCANQESWRRESVTK